MKITIDNIENLDIKQREKNLLKALLKDLENLNQKSRESLYIDIQDYHNEYSPERVDPCPDYYGYYTIRTEKDSFETIGVEMTIDDLDIVMCALCNYIESENK